MGFRAESLSGGGAPPRLASRGMSPFPSLAIPQTSLDGGAWLKFERRRGATQLVVAFLAKIRASPSGARINQDSDQLKLMIITAPVYAMMSAGDK